MTAYDKALSLLSIREHTKKELRDKLLQKGFPSAETEEAITKLEGEGFISEKRYCQCFIRSRLRKNPEGKKLIAMRLIEKGIPRSTAYDEIDSYFEENSEEIKEIFTEYEQKLVRLKGSEKAAHTLMRKCIKLSDYE